MYFEALLRTDHNTLVILSEQQITATAKDQQWAVGMIADIGCRLHSIGRRGELKIFIALLVHPKRVVMEQRIVLLFFHCRRFFSIIIRSYPLSRA